MCSLETQASIHAWKNGSKRNFNYFFMKSDPGLNKENSKAFAYAIFREGGINLSPLSLLLLEKKELLELNLFRFL